MHTSLEISHQLIQLAEDLKDGALIMEGERSLGAALVLAGQCSEALKHLEKGGALYAMHRDHSNKVFTGGFDNKVMVECFAALALLALGYPDQSAERLAAALALGQEVGHPQTLVIAWHVAAQLHQLRGEASLAYQHAKAAMELADEYGLALWVIYGLIELGWEEAELGNPQDGIEKMQRGLAEYEATGAKLRAQYFLGMLADQLGKAERIQEGLLVVAKALDFAESTGEGYALPELHRIKGELLLKSGELIQDGKRSNGSPRSTVLSQARASFANALATAKKQGTRFLELKAALSMHRLDLILGNPNHTQLAKIYSSFTEGFETADLKRAGRLLGASPRA